MAQYSTAHIAAHATFEAEGKVWVMTPLNMKDLVELQDYLRVDNIRVLKSQLADMPIELAKTLFLEAQKDVDRIKIGTQAFDAASQSVSGQMYMMYLSLRHRQPEITLDKAGELLTLTTIEGLKDKLDKMAGYSDDGNPTQAQPQK
jgi:hypothetical protein